MQFCSLGCYDYLSNEEILLVHQPISIYLQCTHSGGVNLHNLEVRYHQNPKTSIFLSMPVLSTISKNGEIVRAKFCPHVFWILLDKTVEELTMFSSINSWLGSWRTRSMVDLQGKAPRRTKLLLEAKLNHAGCPQKRYGASKKNSLKIMKKKAQDLEVFVLFLFYSLSHGKNRTIKRGW